MRSLGPDGRDVAPQEALTDLRGHASAQVVHVELHRVALAILRKALRLPWMSNQTILRFLIRLELLREKKRG